MTGGGQARIASLRHASRTQAAWLEVPMGPETTMHSMLPGGFGLELA